MQGTAQYLTLRPYQQKCVDLAVQKNCIFNIETGGGKTLIAVRTIDRFLVAEPNQKIAFFVPTRVLVKQQADYLRKHCQTGPQVVELCGTEMEAWTEKEWDDTVKVNNILVCTPEVFRNAIVTRGYITVSMFSLLVFDECHNATGNSPMAAVMRDAVALQSFRPRILGLTASFLSGSIKNAPKKRADLEALLLSTMHQVDVELPSSGVSSEKQYHQVTYSAPDISEAEDHTRQLLNNVVFADELEKHGVHIKEFSKTVGQSLVVLRELGLASQLFALREGIIPQMEAHIESLTHLGGPTKPLLNKMKTALPGMKAKLKEAADRLESEGPMVNTPYYSDKLTVLLKLLESLFAQSAGAAEYRGIVFVKEVALTYPLAHAITHHFAHCGAAAAVVARPVSGVSSMPTRVREENVHLFRSGGARLLVCTASCEEGLDVAECAFVVRFSKFDTTKSHVQGAGRARLKNAVVYYFDNDTQEERGNAVLMQRVAADASLSLSASEMHAHVDKVRSQANALSARDSATNDCGQLNIFNARQVISEYVAATMRQSIATDLLFSFNQEVISELPPVTRDTVLSFSCPSPEGFIVFTREQAGQIMNPKDLQNAPRERIRNMSSSDLDKCWLLYCLTVDLRRRGHLTESNKASADAVANTKLVCQVQDSPDKRSLRLKSGVRVRGNPGVPRAVRGGGGGSPVGLVRLSPEEMSLGSPGDQQQEWPGALGQADHKSMLNLQMQKLVCTAKYVTVPEASEGFRSTVVVYAAGDQEVGTFSGQVFPSKKVAEHSAAREALLALRAGGST